MLNKTILHGNRFFTKMKRRSSKSCSDDRATICRLQDAQNHPLIGANARPQVHVEIGEGRFDALAEPVTDPVRIDEGG